MPPRVDLQRLILRLVHQVLVVRDLYQWLDAVIGMLGTSAARPHIACLLA